VIESVSVGSGSVLVGLLVAVCVAEGEGDAGGWLANGADASRQLAVITISMKRNREIRQVFIKPTTSLRFIYSVRLYRELFKIKLTQY
jgi:hypothetical protein